jgi:hypothetical protein
MADAGSIDLDADAQLWSEPRRTLVKIIYFYKGLTEQYTVQYSTGTAGTYNSS